MDKSRNEILYNFFIKALDALLDKNLDQFTFTNEEIVPGENHSLRVEAIDKLNSRMLIIGNLQFLKKLPETEATVTMLIDEGIVPPVLYKTKLARDRPLQDTIEERKGRVVFQLIHMLIDYMEKNEFRYIQEDIDAIISKYEDEWSRPFYNVEIIVPLVGPSEDIGTIVLSEGQLGITIKPFEDEEKERYWSDNFLLLHNVSQTDFFNSKSAIRCSYQIKRDEYDIAPKLYAKAARDNIKKCITCLRIVKEGDIGALAVLEIRENPSIILESGDEFTLGDYGLNKGNFGFIIPRKRYAVNEEDISEIRYYYYVLTKKSNSERLAFLDTGIANFNSIYARHKPEDKLKDAMQCLESTLLSDTSHNSREKKKSVKIPLASRAANLLLKHEDREDFENKLKRLYDIRSSILHEGKIDMKKVQEMNINLSDLADMSVQITRDVLKAYLDYYVVQQNDGKRLARFNDEILDRGPV